MKKVLLLFCSMLMTLGVTAADVTVSVVDGSQNPIGTLGTKSGTTWTSLAASGVADLTVSGASAYDQATAYSARCMTIKPSAVNTVTTITITAPTGYNIENYSLNARLWTSSCPYNVIVDGTTYTPGTGSDTNITSADVNASTATFTIEATGSSLNWLVLKSFTVNLVYASSTVDVTYHILDATKTEISTSAATTQFVDATPAVPESLTGCTYTYYADADCGTELTALTAATTDVYVTYTYTSPFAFETADSYSAISKWYYLRIRPVSGYNNYIKYDSGSTPNVAMTTDGYTTGAEAQEWAFVGDTDPYTGTGLTIYNRAAGSSLILASNTPEGDGATGGNTYATMETSGTKTYQVWFAENNSSVEGGFFLKTADNHYLNRRSTANLAFWTGGHDIGSTFSVVEVPDNYASQVVSDIQPWYDAAESGYFNLTATAKSALETAGYTDALTSCNLDTYNALKAIVDDESNYSFPSSGFYRIKSSGQRIGESYIAYGQPSSASAGLITVTAANAPADLTTVFHFTNDGSNNFVFKTQGNMSVGQQTSANVAFPCTNGGGATFKFDILSPGIVGIYNEASYQSTYVAGYLHEAGWSIPGVVNWNANGSTASYWTVEDAQTATIALNDGGDGNSYATLCVPFEIASITDAKAYTLALDGDYLVPTELVAEEHSGRTILINPGTPVLIVSESCASSTTLTIGSAWASTVNSTTTTNVLTGTYTDLAVTADTDYFLGTDGSAVGFYKWDGTTLGANRAYLKAETASGVKGFALNWDLETAIKTINAGSEKSAIYDLSGRRVEKAMKGIYIVNGKKVVK